MYSIETTTKDLVKEFLRDIRDEDALEIVRATGMSLKDAIFHAVDDSIYSFIVRHEDGILCIFGVTLPDPFSGVASPWMLSTNLVPKHGRVFLRKSREFLRELSKEYHAARS